MHPAGADCSCCGAFPSPDDSLAAAWKWTGQAADQSGFVDVTTAEGLRHLLPLPDSLHAAAGAGTRGTYSSDVWQPSQGRNAKIPEWSGSPLLCHAKEGVLSRPPNGIVLPALQDIAGFINKCRLDDISRAWYGALQLSMWHAAHLLLSLYHVPENGKVRQRLKGIQRDKAARTAASGEQEGLATWLAGPLPSDSAVLEVVSLPSSEKRSQSDESSSPVMNVDAPSWVNSVAPPADAADPAHTCVACQAPSSISSFINRLCCPSCLKAKLLNCDSPKGFSQAHRCPAGLTCNNTRCYPAGTSSWRVLRGLTCVGALPVPTALP